MKLSIEISPDELVQLSHTLRAMGKFTAIQDISDTVQHVENVSRQSLRQQRRMANAMVRLARNLPLALEEESATQEFEEDDGPEFDDGR